jgi:hypothetical protein
MDVIPRSRRRRGICFLLHSRTCPAWEQLNNPSFKPVEFDGFKKQAGLNSFTLAPKQWIEETNAIGNRKRGGGTYTHAASSLTISCFAKTINIVSI